MHLNQGLKEAPAIMWSGAELGLLSLVALDPNQPPSMSSPNLNVARGFSLRDHLMHPPRAIPIGMS